MNTRQKGPSPTPATITLGDVYYILFRHKWLIIVLSLLGLGAAYAVDKMWPFPYNSEAKILIHFIEDATAPSQIDTKLNGSTQVTSPDDRGLNVLNTQLEFLTSGDLALQVATNIGPEKILGKPANTNGVNETAAAAASIKGGLLADVPKNSDIITLTYTASDPAMAQRVLARLLEAYEEKFKEVYRTPGYTDTDLAEQTDLAKTHEADTANTLEAEKVKMGITDLPDAMKNMGEQINRTETVIFQTRTDLAEAEATVKDLQDRLSLSMTNASATNQSSNVTAVVRPPPDADVTARYQSLNTIVNSLRLKEQELLGQFTTNTKVVQNAMQQRKDAEAKLQQFEVENPGVLALKVNAAGAPMQAAAAAKEDPYAVLHDEITKQHALAAKLRELTNQLSLVRSNAEELDAAESKIKTAQSENEVAETKYKFFLMAQAQSRINDATGNKVSGISVVESPTAPFRDGKAVLKATVGVLAFFLALAFGLPFLIELVLDQSFKNPMDVQARINAPFFLTIPITNGHGRSAALKQAKPVRLLSANGSETPGHGTEDPPIPPPANGPVAMRDQRPELRPFFETLRDRLMTYFEMVNLTHKPKLVAVTSCGPGAGVTTTAAGLASSLSETGDGNVLLVNMNVRDGKAHQFYKGKMDCGIEDALGSAKRDQALVHDNLYLAQEMESGDSLPRVLPKRFSHLVPMMKSSDYDYIIFDMPPVSEISITPRLARFMDMVLLVIESEKTSREAAMRVASLLADSKTNVGLVLNKNRSYLPKRLDHTI